VIVPARKVDLAQEGSTTLDVCRGETSFLILAEKHLFNLLIQFLVHLPVVVRQGVYPFQRPQTPLCRGWGRVDPSHQHLRLACLGDNERIPLLSLVDKRNGLATHVVVESDDDNADFWKYFGGKVDVPPGEKKPVKPNPRLHSEWHPSAVKTLTKVELKGTHATYSKVADGKFARSSVDEKGIYVVDVTDEEKEHHIYVYVGKDCDKAASRLGIVIGQEYCRQNKLSENTCVRRIHGGGAHKHALFDKCFDG